MTLEKEHGLAEKPANYVIAKRSLVCLRHIIEVGLNELRRKQHNKRPVRQLLELINYYNDLVKNYSELVTSLSDILKVTKKENIMNGRMWQSPYKNTEIFSTKTYFLIAANINKPFTISTDCSSIGIGFCFKEEKDAILHLISYGSRKLTGNKQKLSSIEGELLSLYHAILKCQRYRMGSVFSAEINHKAFEFWK